MVYIYIYVYIGFLLRTSVAHYICSVFLPFQIHYLFERTVYYVYSSNLVNYINFDVNYLKTIEYWLLELSVF